MQEILPRTTQTKRTKEEESTNYANCANIYGKDLKSGVLFVLIRVIS